MKLVDPARISEADLDYWACGYGALMLGDYVAALACEGPHGLSRARAWLASADDERRATGWSPSGAGTPRCPRFASPQRSVSGRSRSTTATPRARRATRDAREYVEKAWTHATAKGFASPAAHERGRKSMRLRC